MRKPVILCALLFLSVSGERALGCVCVLDPKPTPEKVRADRLAAFEKAAVVFTGEVVFLDLLTVKFKAYKMWKGEEAEEINMLTGTEDNGDGTFTSSSCNYGFRKGQKYLVYAYGPPGELKTYACSRTTLLQYAEDEVRGLDEVTPQRLSAPRGSRTGRPFDAGGEIQRRHAHVNPAEDERGKLEWDDSPLIKISAEARRHGDTVEVNEAVSPCRL